ncbi:MAG: hypothetical protein ACRDS0_06140 [Pseudonocardiaceae bacterium]
MTQIYGIDGGSLDVRAAEHLMAEVVTRLGTDTVLVGCTHLTTTGGPHVTLSIELDGVQDIGRFPLGLHLVRPGSGQGAAAQAAGAHHLRTSGRAVRFPGQQHLTGVLPVGELLAVSAIEAVVIVAGSGYPPDPATLIDTRNFVRPLWQDGRLTLHTMPATNGMLAPFEVANPTPCCADHGP